MAVLSYKDRIEPNRAQATASGDMLADFCQLYNAGLEQRIAAYRRRGISVNYKLQADELKAVRCGDGLRLRKSGKLGFVGVPGAVKVRWHRQGTSRTCRACGILAAKTLAERAHRCECDCVLARDVAAAEVVHFRAFGCRPGAGRGSGPWVAKPAGCRLA